MLSRLRAESRSDVSSQPRNLGLSGLPVQVGGASKSVCPTHSQTILMKQLQNRLTVKRSESTRPNEQLSSSEKVSPSSSQFTDVTKEDSSSRARYQPTRHDRKVLADVFPSNSFLGSSRGSPLTSSWESFTRPVKLTERHRDEDEEGVKGETKVPLAGRSEEGQRSGGDLARKSQKAEVDVTVSACMHHRGAEGGVCV